LLRACRPIDDKAGTIAYRPRLPGVLLKRTAAIASGAPPEELKTMTKLHVSTTINGEPAEFLCEPVRHHARCFARPLGLTGSKEGCASGDCGAGSSMLKRSPGLFLPDAIGRSEGHDIRTIEGMAKGEHLHPLQQKFLEWGVAVWQSAPRHAGRL